MWNTWKTGEIELIMKSNLCVHNFSDFEIYFLGLPWDIVFSVSSGKIYISYASKKM